MTITQLALYKRKAATTQGQEGYTEVEIIKYYPTPQDSKTFLYCLNTHLILPNHIFPIRIKDENEYHVQKVSMESPQELYDMAEKLMENDLLYDHSNGCFAVLQGEILEGLA